jgi:Phosphotransferase enzyme family
VWEDRSVIGLASRIRRASQEWEPAVEAAIFDTVDPDEIEKMIFGFVAERLGSVERAVFYRPGVGVVAGLRLVGGAEVVIKVHRWNVSVDRLAAVQLVQAHMAARGLPAPRPLASPEPLGHGIATVEEMARGGPVDGHQPGVRRAVAVGLRRFIVAGTEIATPAALGPPLMMRPAGAELWFEPHDVRFDFSATSLGAEWIDELAALARSRLDAAIGPPVVGHFDWRVENLGFDQDRIVAIYDWDSLAIAVEAVVVGNAAAQFSADWTSADPDPLPSLPEMTAFVNDYENARDQPFSPAERELLDAANLFACAYGARCQHSDMVLHPKVGRSATVGWLRLLRQRGERACWT